MAYKLKPNKSMLSRFKVTRTGKLKRHHANTSHLMSGRSAKKKRQLGRPAILYEGLARRLRRFMGVSHLHPAQAAHERSARAKSASAAPAGG